MPFISHMLYIQEDQGETPVEVRVFQPVRSSSGWTCRAEIDWPGEPWSYEAYSEFAINALMDALKMTALQIYISAYHAERRLRAYDSVDDGYGFPVLPNLRDLAIGLDAVVEGMADPATLWTPPRP